MKPINNPNKTFKQKATTFMQRLVINVLFGVMACLVYAGMGTTKPETGPKPTDPITEPIKDKEDFIEGTEVLVGINYTLSGNEVSIFTQNKYGLKYLSQFFLSNPNDEIFLPRMRFSVHDTSRADPAESTAQIFISKEAAQRMGISKKLSKGVFRMNIYHVKIIDTYETTK